MMLYPLYPIWIPLPRPPHFPRDPKLDRLLASYDSKIGCFELQMKRRHARALRKGQQPTPSGTRAGRAPRTTSANWAQQAAREGAEAWASEMGLGQIEWESLDEQTVIGRTPNHTVVLRSILLPVGSPDEDIQ